MCETTNNKPASLRVSLEVQKPKVSLDFSHGQICFVREGEKEI